MKADRWTGKEGEVIKGMKDFQCQNCREEFLSMADWESHKQMGCGGDDPVTSPAHYTQGKIQVMDFILDQKFNYPIGQVVRYVSRYEHKGEPLQDLKKAREYLNREIKRLEDI